MKLLAGAVFLLSAEQAYAHSHMVLFPNHDTAAQVLLPASMVLATIGTLLVIWGLIAEVRGTPQH